MPKKDYTKEEIMELLADVVADIKSDKDVLVIRWDRRGTGSYNVNYLGRPMSPSALKALFENIQSSVETNLNDDGYWKDRKDSDATEKSEEEDTTLPWLKKS